MISESSGLDKRMTNSYHPSGFVSISNSNEKKLLLSKERETSFSILEIGWTLHVSVKVT